jgi:hypothetical protein
MMIHAHYCPVISNLAYQLEFFNLHLPSFLSCVRQCVMQPTKLCSVQPHITHLLIEFFDILD